MKELIKKILKEASIIPYDFKQYLEQVRQLAPQIKKIEQLNKIFEKKVFFITLEHFMQLNPEATLPKHYSWIQGIGFGSVIDGIILVICRPQEVISSLYYRTDQTLMIIDIILRHESVHLQQIQRSGGGLKDVDQAGSEEQMDNYYANKQELMAYALTIIDYSRAMGFSKEEIFNKLKSGTLYNPQYYEYVRRFGEDSKVIKRLKKYMVNYLQNENDSQ